MTTTTDIPQKAAITYRHGPFSWHKVSPGILEWTANNKIVLSIYKDPVEGEEPELEEVFNVPVNEIDRVGGAISYLTFYIKGKIYRVSLAFQNARVYAVQMPTTVLAQELQNYQESNVLLWVQTLKAQGIKLKYLKGNSFLILIVLITIAILVLASALVLILNNL